MRLGLGYLHMRKLRNYFRRFGARKPFCADYAHLPILLLALLLSFSLCNFPWHRRSKMNSQLRHTLQRQNQALRFLATSPITPYGRAGPYRRIHAGLMSKRQDSTLLPTSTAASPRLFPCNSFAAFAHLQNQLQPLHSFRHFSSTPSTLYADQSHSEVKDPPRNPTENTADSKSESTNEPPPNGEQEQARKESEEESNEGSQEQKEKKKAPPPPPPHGDKSPWQVFTETLRSEFKASKEWNESTKALASSAHQFTENESIKRARAAYTAASGTATSATTSALKSTGKAIGQGAAWTWETPMIKGVRSGVNVTAKGIDIATKPVRETAAYKKTVGTVKQVIDDGSSSKYGGWVEKEERRKQRELRELNEIGGGRVKPAEKMEEDPKFVSPPNYMPSSTLSSYYTSLTSSVILFEANIIPPSPAPAPTSPCTKTPPGANPGPTSNRNPA